MRENPGAGTIGELMELAAGPVLMAMPDRPSVDDAYYPDITDDELRAQGVLSADPADLVAEVERHMQWAAFLDMSALGEQGELNEAGLRAFSLMMRGSVRAVVSGVYADEPYAIDLRCYGDELYALVMNFDAEGNAEMRGVELAKLPELVLAYLPSAPDGVVETIRVPADQRGVIDQGYEEEAGLVAEFLARERLGTTVVDLVAFGGLCAEYPEHGVLIIDNDLGRHVLATFGGDGEPRELVLTRMSPDLLLAWLSKSVEAGRPGLA